MNTVTLHCETGNHDWQRPSQRGKRPRNCPEHSAAKPEQNGSEPKMSREEALDKAREIRAAQRQQERSQEAQQFYALLGSEQRRAVAYIDSQIDSGRTDISHLLERRKDILDRAARRRVA